MLRTMLYAKLHRVTVTQADLDYVGSVTIDRTLLQAARLLPGEQVSIVDVGGDPGLVPDGFGLEASGTPRGQL